MRQLVDQDGIQQCWERYHQARAAAATGNHTFMLRDELVIRYVALIGYVVGRMAVNFPPAIDRRDLEQVGAIGLMKAIERYEPRPGVDFEAYALSRIHGAVTDYLREEDFLPRSVRRKAKAMEKSISALVGTLGRSPSQEEAAEACGVTVDQYRSDCELIGYHLVSLDSILVGSDGQARSALINTLVAEGETTPEQHAIEQALTNELAGAFTKLPERERTVLGLYYQDGLVQAEIARVLDVSESRVSQIHSSAIALLRGHLQHTREGAALSR